MKIAFFSDVYKPQINGIVTVISTLKHKLTRMGHEVIIICPEYPDAEQEENVFRISSFKYFFKPENRIATPSSSDQKYLRHILRFKRIDLIHTHTESSISSLAKNVAQKEGIPLVHTAHTYFEHYLHFFPLPKSMARKIMSAQIKSLAASADAIITPSRKVKELLQKYSVNCPMEIVPNGIELGPFLRKKSPQRIQKLRASFSIKPHEKILCFVGRVSREKNVSMLIKSFAEASYQLPNIKLIIAGDSSERKTFEEDCQLLGIKNKVIFTGYREYPYGVADILAASDAFISASLSEVHPLTFIEALASGLPVIAYRDSSIEGVVKENKNGLLESCAKSLGPNIIRLLSSDYLLSDLSQQARETAKFFSLENFALHSLEFYQKILSQNTAYLKAI